MQSTADRCRASEPEPVPDRELNPLAGPAAAPAADPEPAPEEAQLHEAIGLSIKADYVDRFTPAVDHPSAFSEVDGAKGVSAFA